MPLYPVKNLKTGEQKEIQMLVEDYEKWREENPDWDKDWSKGVAGFRTRSSDWYSSDAVANPGAYEDKNNSLSASLTSNERPSQRDPSLAKNDNAHLFRH